MGWFRKKRVAEAPPDPLALLSSALSAASGRGAVISASPSDAESCKAWLSREGSGSLRVCLHAAAAEPFAGLILPPSLSLDAAAAESLAASFMAGLPEPWSSGSVYALPSPPDQLAVLWPLLELETLSLEWDGKRAWLFVERALKDALAAPASPEPVAAQPSPPPASVGIGRPRDFLAFSPLLPPSFAVGKYGFSVDLSSFALTQGAEASASMPHGQDALWYLAGFALPQAEGKPARQVSLVLSFQGSALGGARGGPDPEATTKALAAGLSQAAAASYAAATGLAPSSPGYKRLPTPPDLSRSGSLLTVSCLVSGPAFRLPLGVALPIAALAPAFRRSLGDAAFLRLSPRPEALVLAANGSILASRLQAQLSPPALREKIPSYLVCELLNQLSDGDYDLVLQNCLINAMGAKELPGLFYYNASVTGADGVVRERTGALGPLDARRLFSHMPEAFRDDYVAFSGRLHANPAPLCLSKNQKAMRSISEAILSKRIEASPRLRALVAEYFLKPSRARDEAELASLKAKGLPFGSLDGLPPRMAQAALARVDDRDLALALLDCREELGTISRWVSTARAARLEEELSFIAPKRESGETGPEELLRAKRLVQEAAAEVKRIEVIERESKRERAQAAPAERGGPTSSPVLGRRKAPR